MHEDGALIGGGHGVGVDLPLGEGLAAHRVLLLVAHGRPDVSRHEIGAAAAFDGIVEDLEMVARKRQGGIKLIALGAREVELEAEQLGGLDPGVGHVVGVAHPGDGLAGDRTAVLLEGEDVGEDLAGMVFVRETVDDGHPTVNGHVVKTVLAEGAHHDQVAHAADHAGRVGDGLGAADLGALALQIDDVATKLVEARLEANAGTRARLFEHHDEHLACERFISLARLQVRLDDLGAVDHVAKGFTGKVAELQKMAGHVATPKKNVRCDIVAAHILARRSGAFKFKCTPLEDSPTD